MMNEEYGLELAQMERDYTLAGEDAEGKKLSEDLGELKGGTDAYSAKLKERIAKIKK